MEKASTKKHWQKYWSGGDHQPLVTHEELLKNLVATTKVCGKKILEIGAGMGGDSVYLARAGAEVTALDFAPEALRETEKNAQKEGIKINTIQADAHKIPFPDATFDIVFHQGFLEHFSNPLELLLEQVRVLKKGGYLVVDVPQRYTTYTLKKHILMLQGKWFTGWEREFSIGELEKLIRCAGMVPRRAYGWGYYGKLYNLRHLNLGKLYEFFWRWTERGRLKLYLSWCIGVIAQKE